VGDFTASSSILNGVKENGEKLAGKGEGNLKEGAGSRKGEGMYDTKRFQLTNAAIYFSKDAAASLTWGRMQNQKFTSGEKRKGGLEGR